MTFMCVRARVCVNVERERLAFALCGMERELSASNGSEISFNERGSDFVFAAYRELE